MGHVFAASPGFPAPLQHPGIAEERADDDVLIEKLRARAWDPGRRFDRARVPSAWITERYGAEWFDRPHPGLRATGSDGSVTLGSWAEEVATYYADAPRGPLFPPVTMAEVEDVERRVGRRLPDLLRRIWTEVADGGFGPDGGLVSVREGNRVQGHLSDWPSAVKVQERDRAEGVPTSWFYLTGGGCTMHWYVSLLAVENPVLLYDCDGWEPGWGETPHDGLRHATASLRKWFWTWAEGGNVWREVLDR
ncbi:hypothetical protein BOQ63_000575 (plasmid) [Streptomyces viridifaciens]|nr:hypothetical protein BOQ63_000575 [Streptomyces viridifaciens]